MIVELANRLEEVQGKHRARVVGNWFVVTNRDVGRSGIVARFLTRGEAEAYIEAHR